MQRNWTKVVHGDNGPAPQQEKFGSDQPTLADVYRRFEESIDRRLKIMKSCIDQQDKKLNELTEMRGTSRRLASLEHDDRQPRLAMKADMQADTKTRERTEGVATAVQAMHGDSCSANRVDPDPMFFTSFASDSTGLPTLPCSRDDALVGKGAAASKSCLSPLEMRTKTAAGRLLPTGKNSTATSATYDISTL